MVKDSEKNTDRIENRSPEDLLKLHGIRPTAMRVLICREIMSIHDTFSMTELETRLDTVDKSTVFRTLQLFASHHLLHEIEDGSGSRKYCLCHNDHECAVDEMHCHFFCEVCDKTYCLDNIQIPQVNLPEGYSLHKVEYILKGVCPQCGANSR